MVTNIQKLISSRDLIKMWTSRTIKGRYQQSYVGWLWAVIQPVVTVIIFTILFTYFVPIDTGGTPYPVFSYVAVVPWTFLATSLTDMANSLIGNMNLITKIYFPREALPLAAMFARLLDFGVSAMLLVLLIVYYQVPVYPPGWLFLPIILIVQMALISGLGLAASALSVFSRDAQPLITLGLQLWFYASPIIYPVSVVPERLQSLYFLNPMAGILEAYRDVLIRGSLPGQYLIYSAIEATLIFLIGYWFFKRVEPVFADII
ncbi:MAG: ABC transporter permease [Desulfobacteraceae bacterium]|nr:ABC transporter permease [Desulfobacteraceae bacterium]